MTVQSSVEYIEIFFVICRYDHASQLYNTILEDDETNTVSVLSVCIFCYFHVFYKHDALYTK